MKVNQMLVVLLLGISSTLTAFGQVEKSIPSKTLKPIDLVQVADQDSWHVRYISIGAEDVTVKILDETGNRVFRQRIPQEELAQKTFSLSRLPRGVYTFDINQGAYTETVELLPEGMEDPLIVNLLPAATQQKYELVVSDETVEELEVRIYDENSSLLFFENIALDDNQKRRFDLRQVKAEALVFVISDGERQTTETLVLR